MHIVQKPLFLYINTVALRVSTPKKNYSFPEGKNKIKWLYTFMKYSYHFPEKIYQNGSLFSRKTDGVPPVIFDCCG